MVSSLSQHFIPSPFPEVTLLTVSNVSFQTFFYTFTYIYIYTIGICTFCFFIKCNYMKRQLAFFLLIIYLSDLFKFTKEFELVIYSHTVVGSV